MPKGTADDVISEFHKVVNMKPKELEGWLESDDSQAVGWSSDGGESVSLDFSI
jgi:hypothetical protein